MDVDLFDPQGTSSEISNSKCIKCIGAGTSPDNNLISSLLTDFHQTVSECYQRDVETLVYISWFQYKYYGGHTQKKLNIYFWKID